MRARGGWPLVSLALLSAALAVAAVARALAPAVPADAPLALEVSPVPLDDADPGRESVGALRFLGGLRLRSADLRFGGLSDLRVSPDGSRMLAVSDCGHGLVASLSYDAAGRLAGLSGARLVALTGPTGGPLGLGESDAESLVAAEGLEVGFEGRARVVAYRTDPPFAGPGRVRPFPAAARRCGGNGGIEAMADAGGGRRFLVCESRRGASASVPAWLGRDGEWVEREYPLRFEGGWAGEPFRPSGAARLPGGDLLLVERRFPPLGARIVRVDAASLGGSGPLEPRELARLEAPLAIDNFEGIETRTDAAGRTLVYLLSDDNDCAKSAGAEKRGLQRTLLLLFALEERGAERP